VGNGFNATIVDSSGSYCPAGSALASIVVDSRSDSGAPAAYTALTSITFESGFETFTGDIFQTVINPALTTCTPPSSGGGTSSTGSASGLSEAYPIGLDAYSFSLHYYPQDYKPIGATTPVLDVLQGLGGSAAPLYNGNIAAMAVVINPGVDSPLVYNYHYDQLNRLSQMDAFKGLNYANHTFTPVQLPDYQERPAYDPNGNITNYVRHGYGANIPMDSLTYNYYANTNQLQRINDGAGGVYTTDLKDQGTGSNYTYDLIGNLKQDLTNGVTAINWTVYGKIDSIDNSSGWITYTYDAAGNRITKTSGGVTSVYVRDAQGNILSIYNQTGSGSPTQQEVDLYGSSRLGSVRALTVAPTTVTLGGVYGVATTSTFTRGEKSYELTNHLGNVLSTVTDKKIAVVSGSNSSLIDHFTADIATAQDYYPFGMLMPGRTYTASTATNYRFGFNGKENDNEVKGVGDQIDYGMRYYDPRAGRFMSVDPLTKKYPELTPYQYASNTPIWAIDLDGLEKMTPTGGYPSNDPNQLPPGFQASNLLNEFDPQKSSPSTKPAQKKQSNIDLSKAIFVAQMKCHPDGQAIIDKVNAEFAKEYSKLDFAHGQVDFPRSSFWTAWDGPRTLGEHNYVNGKLYSSNTIVDDNGYITNRLAPTGGTVIVPGSFGGAGTFEMFNSAEVGLFISTEEGAQGLEKVESIKQAIRDKDLFIWSEPVKVVRYEGQIYILNGHHRLKAFSELVSDEKVSVQVLSPEEVAKDVMDYIKQGAFNTPIKASN